jgi:hypothetical protein
MFENLCEQEIETVSKMYCTYQNQWNLIYEEPVLITAFWRPADSSKVLVTLYQRAWCHIPVDNKLDTYLC